MSFISIIYLLLTAAMILLIARKKEIVLFGAAAIFAVGLVWSHSPAEAVQVLCRAVSVGFDSLLSIFIGMSLIMTMTYALHATGVDVYLSESLHKLPRNASASFFIIGAVMAIVSFMIWPSPAVALLGALIQPIAVETGLPPVYIAVALNIFGHGAALSGDFLIQGVPSIAAQGAGMQSSDIMSYLVPLWAVMTGVTVLMSFIMMRRDLKKHPYTKTRNTYASKSGGTVQHCSRNQKKLIVALILLAFAADIAAMILLHINGDDATNLIAGTALVLTCIISLIAFRGNTCAEKLGDFLVDGFSFTVKGFAPAVIMIGFFSLGSSEFAPMILGENAPACLSETVGFLVSHAKIPGAALAFLQSAVGIIYSLDGSGFAGLTVIGSIANSYPVAADAVKILTALGQIVIIWVGGGTIIPWSVIPVSSVCGVKPVELAKKNLVPVLTGIAAATVMAACMIACAK